MTFFIISTLLIIAVSFYLLYIVAVLMIRAVDLAVTLFKLLTGRMTREQLAEKLAKDEERKKRAKMKRRGFFRRLWDSLSDPSSLPEPIRSAMGHPF